MKDEVKYDEQQLRKWDARWLDVFPTYPASHWLNVPFWHLIIAPRKREGKKR